MKRYSLLIMLIIFITLSAESATAASWKPKGDEYWIKINKEQLRLTLYKGFEPYKSWYVSVGRGRGPVKKSRTDLITPTGTFTIYRVVPDATKLVFDPSWFDEPGKPQDGVYGSKLISFYNKWQIAIHGTNNPRSIGKWATHGCIRMRNADIEDLVSYVRPKMKLIIVESNKDRKFYKETI
ncbi:MAG: L,D-transpeptidase [Synergistaceae bacterium]|nr:L,D-transpeptidase [Synergistaceae bacterium]